MFIFFLSLSLKIYFTWFVPFLHNYACKQLRTDNHSAFDKVGRKKENITFRGRLCFVNRGDSRFARILILKVNDKYAYAEFSNNNSVEFIGDGLQCRFGTYSRHVSRIKKNEQRKARD